MCLPRPRRTQSAGLHRAINQEEMALMFLSSEFKEVVTAISQNQHMGVELVSPLLYDLVQLHRPRVVLEVGAGYSTMFLLQALADNKRDFDAERQLIDGQVRSDQHTGLTRILKGRHPLPLGLPEYYAHGYAPRLLVVDDLSHPGTAGGAVEKAAARLGINEFLHFYRGDFRGMSKKLAAEDLPIDFFWFDCGGFDHYRAMIAEYWPFINPNGGLLLLHSTLTNIETRSIVLDIKLRQATDGFRKFELLSLLEPHKWRQNSITLIRMTDGGDEPIYSRGP